MSDSQELTNISDSNTKSEKIKEVVDFYVNIFLDLSSKGDQCEWVKHTLTINQIMHRYGEAYHEQITKDLLERKYLDQLISLGWIVVPHHFFDHRGRQYAAKITVDEVMEYKRKMGLMAL